MFANIERYSILIVFYVSCLLYARAHARRERKERREKRRKEGRGEKGKRGREGERFIILYLYVTIYKVFRANGIRMELERNWKILHKKN